MKMKMKMKNKITLEAPFILTKSVNKRQIREIAKQLDLPENDQRDLLFMSAILVSTGTNKNGATFLGSELIKARNSITQKALDIEHEEEKIIGHITSSVYMDQAGEVLNDEGMFEVLTNKEEEICSKATVEYDNMDMDIGVVCIVYKDRFPEIAEEIEEGKWKVSMECYYEDYDIKIGDLIIPKESLASYDNIEDKVNKDLKLVLAGKTMGTSRVSRVLRNIRFCGVGIVENPANERSIIIESAANNIKNTLSKEGLDPSMLEAATCTVDSSEELQIVNLSEDKKSNVVQVQSTGYYIVRQKNEEIEIVKDSFNMNYNEVAKEAVRRSSLDKDSSYSIVKANSKFISRGSVELNETSEAVTFNTDEVGTIKEIHQYGIDEERENSNNNGQPNKWGPDNNSAGICISFRKYLYETPGLPSPGKILSTHWCKLFNKSCPVFGADAHASECLRNKFSRMIKEDEIFGDYTREYPFNPRIPMSETTFIDSSDLPSPNLAAPIGVEGLEPPPTLEVNNSGPDNPSRFAKVSTFNFPTKIDKLTREERSSLSDDQFALPNSRKFPIHNRESLDVTMKLFNSFKKKLSRSDQKTLFNSLIKASLKLGVDSTEFENSSSGFAFKPGKDYSIDFGIPRLELLPLGSRQQVISAMSRFDSLKVDISDTERDMLVVNILRACKAFDIDSTKFRERIKKS